jgi:hypothetical protein
MAFQPSLWRRQPAEAPIEDHKAVNDKGTRTPQSTDHRLRLSGSGEAPRTRGLVHLGALVVALPASAALVWRDGVGGGVGL